MAIMVNFRVIAWAELNGRLRIDRTVQIDNQYASRLRSDRKALVRFIENQYPGARIVENSITVRITHIPTSQATAETSPKSQAKAKAPKERIRNEKETAAQTPSPSKRDDAETKLRQKIELEKLRGELSKIRFQYRQQKSAQLREAYEGRRKDVWFYVRSIWIRLDTPGKKALAIIVVWLILGQLFRGVLFS